jgi:thioredoxin 1
MKEIINSKFDPSEYDVVIVDFWADWCMPCKMQLPTLTKLSNEMPNVTFIKANVEENVELATSYKIVSIPSLLIFKNGKLLTTLVGLQQENKLREALLLASQ